MSASELIVNSDPGYFEGAVASSADQPVLAGFYPDPTVCRVGDTYYLATSSFEYFPGAPLWSSTDLMTWTQVGHILTRRSQFPIGDAGPSKGIYGSTLRHHDGRFWFITTNAGRYEDGQLLVQAADPAGPWSDPIVIADAVGIDPDIAWDGDTCYLTWKQLSFIDGDLGLVQAVLDTTTGAIGPAYPIWQGTGMTAPEGPHLYQVDTYWYLLLAEGGTERGHSVTVARADNPFGPFEPAPTNPVLTHRSSDSSVQNAGHADLVQGPDGRWAAVHLGARTRGSIPGFHVLGRETFLARVDWVDGWPVFREGQDLLQVPDHSFEEPFSGPSLDARWVAADAEPDGLVQVTDEGLVFTRQWQGATDLLCTRVRDLRWSAEVDSTGDTALVLRIDDRHWYAVLVEGELVRAQARIGDLERSFASHQVHGAITLCIEAVNPKTLPVPLGHAGPDDIVLSARANGATVELARLDGRYLSSEVASGFTGRMLGIGALDGETRVRRFRYHTTA